MKNFNKEKNYNYVNNEELQLEKKFSKDGFCVFNIKEKNKLEQISLIVKELMAEHLKIRFNKFDLNNLHSYCDQKKINNLRFSIFKKLNKEKWLRPTYYNIFKKYLDMLVGNELSMQNQLNLSIQMPNDKSSTLPMHADSFNGESPFQVIAWLPLVNCSGSNSMYFIPPNISNKLVMKLNKFSKKNKGGLKKITKNFNFEKYFLKINYGQALIFSANYLHGNHLNKTNQTRTSLNTRFKSLLSPYTSTEKTLGAFYEPVIIKTITKKGINFKKPGKFSLK